jgi:hypothetical protein
LVNVFETKFWLTVEIDITVLFVIDLRTF